MSESTEPTLESEETEERMPQDGAASGQPLDALAVYNQIAET